MPKTLSAYEYNPTSKHVTAITNLKSSYSRNEVARFRLFVRGKDWNPTIYTKAVSTITGTIIDEAFYKVSRAVDGYKIIDYGTGTLKHTKLSYDTSGSYFDLDLTMLEADYAYELKFLYYINGKYAEQPEIFKFRVE